MKLQSRLFEMLEGNTGKSDNYSDDEIESVLVEMGNPEELAQMYTGKKKYLVGPKYFKVYVSVISMVSIFVGGGVLIANIAKIASEAQLGFGQFLVQLLSAIFQAIAAVAATGGYVTLSFYLFERFADKDENEIEEHWSLEKLPEVPHEVRKFSLLENILGIVFLTIGFAVINFFIDRIGMYYFDETAKFVKIFNPDFLSKFVPLITIGIIASFIKVVVVTYQKRWTYATSSLDIVLDIYSLIVFYMIAGFKDILTMEFMNVEEIAQFQDLIELFNGGLNIGLYFVCGVIFIGIITKTIKLIKN